MKFKEVVGISMEDFSVINKQIYVNEKAYSDSAS